MKPDRLFPLGTIKPLRVSEKEADLKRWRPKDWENPYARLPGFMPPMKAARQEAFEAGADAMYQECRKKLGMMAFLLEEEKWNGNL